jgi:hypothetical protein
VTGGWISRCETNPHFIFFQKQDGWKLAPPARRPRGAALVDLDSTATWTSC